MEFYDVVRTRRTSREWLQGDIPADAIRRIIGAGLRAPSNDHMRNWEFIVLRTSEEKQNALQFVKAWAEGQNGGRKDLPAQSIEHQMYAHAIPRQYTMLSDAACVIIPVFKAAPAFYKPSAVNHLNSFASIWCVIENILLAATAEKLGSCVRIPVGDEGGRLAECLQVPDGYVAACYIGLGYPAEQEARLEQYRFEPDEKMHFGVW